MKRKEEIRCLVVGSDSIGKTSLLVTQATGQFPSDHLPTVFRQIEVNNESSDSKRIITIGDSANQESYDRQRLCSYVGTDLVIICYSITDPQSLDDVTEKWVPEIRNYSSSLPFIVVGLKSDEREGSSKRSSRTSKSSYRESVDSVESVCSITEEDSVPPWISVHFRQLKVVDRKQAKRVVRTSGALVHVECSAKTSVGVKHLFESVIPSIVEQHVVKRKKKTGLGHKIGKLFANGSKKRFEKADLNDAETQSIRST